VFKYDTEPDAWSTLAPMPHIASEHSASVLDGLIYIVGAGDDRCGVLRFDPVSGAWNTLAPTLNLSCWVAACIRQEDLYTVYP
jgi:hypothetical protein